jgi:hypothetical protein
VTSLTEWVQTALTGTESAHFLWQDCATRFLLRRIGIVTVGYGFGKVFVRSNWFSNKNDVPEIAEFISTESLAGRYRKFCSAGMTEP